MRPRSDEDEKTSRISRLRASGDVLGASVLAVVAAGATALPEGNQARLLVTLPILLFVPGYLLMQALRLERNAPRPWLDTLIAVGISPPLVGLVALSTSLVPGGFRPVPIIVAVTTTCILMGVIALTRRMVWPDPAPTAA